MKSLAISLAKARNWAKLAHHDQRYGAHPYTYHLDAVRSVAFEFGIIDEDVLVATLLHDIVEDTSVTACMLIKPFGQDVANLVQAVTTAPGNIRKDRATETYQQICAVPGAVDLKLCDRIANTRQCWTEIQIQDSNKRGKGKLGMYKQEYGSFRKALRFAPRGVRLNLWNELDKLMNWQN